MGKAISCQLRRLCGACHGRVILALLLACPLVTAGAPETSKALQGGKAAKRAMAEIRKHYKDPSIGQQECPFPGLLAFTAFERANLGEHPLIPDQWFAVPGSPVVKTLPLAGIRCQPKDTLEAVALATWLFSTEYPWSLIKATRVEEAGPAGGIRIVFQAEIGLEHPLFRQGRRPGKAVVSVVDGRWSMQVDDPFSGRADSLE